MWTTKIHSSLTQKNLNQSLNPTKESPGCTAEKRTPSLLHRLVVAAYRLLLIQTLLDHQQTVDSLGWHFLPPLDHDALPRQQKAPLHLSVACLYPKIHLVDYLLLSLPFSHTLGCELLLPCLM